MSAPSAEQAPQPIELTDAQITALAEEALNAAALHIQESLGVPSGDVAGVYFSGNVHAGAIALFSDYIRKELWFKKD